DLDQVAVAYRFEQSELDDFMRRLFRPEFLREQEHAAQALCSQPETGGGGSGAGAADWGELGTPTPTAATRTATGELPPPGAVAARAETDPGENGFWARWRRWRR